MPALKLVSNISEASNLIPNNKISTVSDLNKLFISSQYQIMQPYFQIFKEGYNIVSEDQSEQYSAVRPRSWFKRFMSKVLSWGTGFGSFIFFLIGSFKVATKEQTVLLITLCVLSVVASIAAAILMIKLTAPKRKATLSNRNNNELFSIQPSSGHFFFNHEYNIQSNSGHVMAIFKKRFLENIFRIHWHCYNPQGQYLFSASEDSIFMSLMRRYFIFGKYIPIHFVFHKQGGKKFGDFIRKYSLKDKYKLDYNTNAIDGWLVVATAILLDTGEER